MVEKGSLLWLPGSSERGREHLCLWPASLLPSIGPSPHCRVPSLLLSSASLVLPGNTPRHPQTLLDVLPDASQSHQLGRNVCLSHYGRMEGWVWAAVSSPQAPSSTFYIHFHSAVCLYPERLLTEFWLCCAVSYSLSFQSTPVQFCGQHFLSM